MCFYLETAFVPHLCWNCYNFEMITTSTPAEQRTLLKNISWPTFEAILRDTGEDRGWRFAYDQGTLKIIAPLFEPENYKSNLGNFIMALGEELNIEVKSAGCDDAEARRFKERHRTG
jgi:hypothetical protein